MALAELKYVSTRGNAYGLKEHAEIDSILHKAEWPIAYNGDVPVEQTACHEYLVKAIAVALKEAGYWIADDEDDDDLDDEDDGPPVKRSIRKKKLARRRM